MFLLLGWLIGSSFNIPLFESSGHVTGEAHVVQLFGMHYQVPPASGSAGTIVAVNVGVDLSCCLICCCITNYGSRERCRRDRCRGCYLLAAPIPEMGIAIPVFVPVICRGHRRSRA